MLYGCNAWTQIKQSEKNLFEQHKDDAYCFELIMEAATT